MYIPSQFMIAMENDRLRSLEPRRRDRRPRRAIIRAFRARPATGQAL